MLALWITLRLDRLGRDSVDILTTLREREGRGVTAHFADLGGMALASSGPFGKAMLSIIATFANLEKDLISQRTREALSAAK